MYFPFGSIRRHLDIVEILLFLKSPENRGGVAGSVLGRRWRRVRRRPLSLCLYPRGDERKRRKRVFGCDRRRRKKKSDDGGGIRVTRPSSHRQWGLGRGRKEEKIGGPSVFQVFREKGRKKERKGVQIVTQRKRKRKRGKEKGSKLSFRHITRFTFLLRTHPLSFFSRRIKRWA